MIQPGGGYTGVGASAPQAPLNVVGTSWFQGDSTPLSASAGQGVAVGFGGEQGYIFGFDYTTFAPKNLLLQNPGGNVGIGTLNPTAGRLRRGDRQPGASAARHRAERARRPAWPANRHGLMRARYESRAGRPGDRGIQRIFYLSATHQLAPPPLWPVS